MADTTRIESLNVLLDGSESGKMLLKEAYDGVLENVQKQAVSVQLKNTDLSGDPTAGTVEAKRFVNSASQNYGTARTAGKGNAVKGKTVTIPIDTDKEFVEEIEDKDIKLLGVDGIVAKRSSNHAMRMAAELDEKFFAVGKTSGTQFKPAKAVTSIQDIVENAILLLENLKNDYIDGLPRDMIRIVFDAETYSQMRMYLDTVVNTNVDTTTESFVMYHGVRCYSSNRLPAGVKFEIMMNESIAQPVMSQSYSAEKIPLSNAVAIELYFNYGTKAVTPDTIYWYDGTHAES
nr:MAG TPA: major capsid protein [Caudoviricetes sp.]